MRKIRQAVILAGGMGTRLRPLTDTVPKPMIRIHGKPFLWYIVNVLRRNKITHIVLLVGYLHEQIEQYFGNGKKFGVSISYAFAPVEADTGTRIRQALPLLDPFFLLLYGDNLWPLNIDELTDFYEKSHAQASVVVYSNRDKATRNNVFVDESSFISTYDRKRLTKNLNGVDIGFFILNKGILIDLPKDNFSFEDIVIPRLVKEKQLAAFFTQQKYYGLSTPDRIPSIKKYLEFKKVIFLDRDGVINKRPPKAQYIHSWEQFIFLPNVKKALKVLKNRGYSVYIITNQPGIAQGKIKKAEVNRIHRNLIREVRQSGGTIDGVYMCPHGWHDGCFCRKPNPGLFFQAAYEHAINLPDSICIGDDERDIMAGNRAACKTIFIADTFSINQFSPSGKPDAIFPTLFDAVKSL